MIFLGLNKISEERARIVLIHNFPQELDTETLTTGVLVEELPVAENITGKLPIYFYNYADSTVGVEYEKLPLSMDEILNKRLEEQEQAIIELASMLGGEV